MYFWKVGTIDSGMTEVIKADTANKKFTVAKHEVMTKLGAFTMAVTP